MSSLSTVEVPAALATSAGVRRAPALAARRNDEAMRVRREAISIHLTFAHMLPLIHRTRRLSLNAILASARLAEKGEPFSIVANELNSVATDLDALIADIERVFRALVSGIARWAKAELRLGYLLRALGKLPREAARQGARLPLGPQERETIGSLLRHCKRQLQVAMSGELENIDVLTSQLAGRIDRINWVAVRQCHYTSISAQIEAAQVDDGRSDLADVAADIRTLADDIAQAERRAKERAGELRYLLKSRLSALKKGVNHD